MKGVVSTTCALFVAAWLATPTPARAVPGTLGVGLGLGFPTSLTGKYFADPQLAFDFALDFYNQFGLHGDALWHVATLTRNRSVSLPFYLGVGFQFGPWYEERYIWKGRWYYSYRGHPNLGVRIPFGLAVWLNRTPLELFLELGPQIWLFDPQADLFATLGFRFYF